jgi:hypothetical protein
VEPVPFEGDTAGIGANPTGRWERAEGTDITTDAGLAERGAWHLAEAETVRPTYDVNCTAVRGGAGRTSTPATGCGCA